MVQNAHLIIGIALTIIGTSIFASSIGVNCQGSLAAAGVCEEWRRSTVLNLWVAGAIFWSVAFAVLVLGRTKESKLYKPTEEPVGKR